MPESDDDPSSKIISPLPPSALKVYALRFGFSSPAIVRGGPKASAAQWLPIPISLPSQLRRSAPCPSVGGAPRKRGGFCLFGHGLGCQFITCQLLRCSQSIRSADLYIGFYALALPVALGNRVDRPTEGHTNGEMVAHWQALHGMSTSTRGLANDGGALLCLQIEGKLLSARESLVLGEHVHRLVGEARARNPGKSPVLMCLVLVPVGEVVDVGSLREQIRNHEFNHLGITAMILPQVKNKSIRVGHKVHGSDHRGCAYIWRRKGPEFDVADVVIEDFELGKTTVLLLHHGTKARLLGGAWRVRSRGRTGLLG